MGICLWVMRLRNLFDLFDDFTDVERLAFDLVKPNRINEEVVTNQKF